MKPKKAKITYDPKAKILSIRLSKDKSVDSDARGNVVLDYDARGGLVNIDIMSMSLNDFVPRPAMKQLLRAAA